MLKSSSPWPFIETYLRNHLYALERFGKLRALAPWQALLLPAKINDHWKHFLQLQQESAGLHESDYPPQPDSFLGLDDHMRTHYFLWTLKSCVTLCISGLFNHSDRHYICSHYPLINCFFFFILYTIRSAKILILNLWSDHRKFFLWAPRLWIGRRWVFIVRFYLKKRRKKCLISKLKIIDDSYVFQFLFDKSKFNISSSHSVI